jgi:hypothetical protein
LVSFSRGGSATAVAPSPSPVVISLIDFIQKARNPGSKYRKAKTKYRKVPGFMAPWIPD